MTGSNEYLTKPFDPDDLVAKVSKYLPNAAFSGQERMPAIEIGLMQSPV